MEAFSRREKVMEASSRREVMEASSRRVAPALLTQI
jgi:hypothetical protein